MIRIETLIREGYSDGEIGIKIGKDKTTVYRCIKKSEKPREKFSGKEAWEKVSERRSEANKHYRILDESALSKYILEKVVLFWSPEQIAGKWSEDTGEALCHETIYQWVYKNHPRLIKFYFRRKGKKYIKKRKEKYQIMDRRMIDERPEDVENRLEVGHWEGDTIVGKGHKGAIVTNVERKTGFLIASKLKDSSEEKQRAEILADMTIEDFKDLPEEIRVSMTYDNGREFAWHKVIEGTTAMTVYFAHPYSPWERGTNENTNGLLREFIPKGTDFSTVSEENLQKYVHLINNRPRKRLKFLSPAQAFALELQRCTSQ
jgi:transposase, IS30 family